MTWKIKFYCFDSHCWSAKCSTYFNHKRDRANDCFFCVFVFVCYSPMNDVLGHITANRDRQRYEEKKNNEGNKYEWIFFIDIPWPFQCFTFDFHFIAHYIWTVLFYFRTYFGHNWYHTTKAHTWFYSTHNYLIILLYQYHLIIHIFSAWVMKLFHF